MTAGVKCLGENPVLIICKNYTGDRLHFGMAVENANRMGRQVELVVVADDVSVGKKQGGRVGRRGLAGTVLVHKIAGGCAQGNRSLAEVKAQATEIIENLVTVGASLSHASVPGSTSEEVKLGADEIEIGMGIHNEPGFEKIKTPKVSDLSRLLLRQLLNQEDEDRSFVPFKSGDEVVLLINNLGAVSSLELYHLTQIVADQVEKDWNLTIQRTYTGAFMTSLDGAGISITLLNLSNLKDRVAILRYLDLPSDAPGWNSAVKPETWSSTSREIATKLDVKARADHVIGVDSKLVKKMITSACQSLISSEPEITKYDTVAGDGDAGVTLKTASEAVLSGLDDGRISTNNLIDLFGDIAAILEDKMGGTSGALYTIYFAASASFLNTTKSSSVDEHLMADTVKSALARLCTYTTATVGDKTMMDALIPFSKVFSETQSFTEALEAAKKGALSTKGMLAGLGRASYVDSSASATVPDAGAVGVWKLLAGLARTM